MITPPKEAQPLYVTKSPNTAPCAVSVIVKIFDPFVAAKDISLAPVVTRKGVTS